MILEIKNISKAYKDKLALDNVSLLMKPGLYGLLGPNGAGKTTLINIITGLLRPDKGSIEASSFSGSYINSIGYLPQKQCYYNNFTGIEFIEYIMILKNYRCDKSKEYANSLLEKVNLSDVANKKIKTYSGGMKQRIGIAQALVGNPELLIFDEPTAGLDPEERIRFRNLLSYISTDRTVILSTHIVTDISYIAKEIIMLANGKVISTGTQSDIISTINNKVWEFFCNEEEVVEQMSLNKISNISPTENGCILRVVCEKKPAKNAHNVIPNLDDVCLYYFNEVTK